MASPRHCLARPSPPPLARGSTAQRLGEPAWHRRRRRDRGNARALLRIAAAANLLNGHHSAQNPMPDAQLGGKGQKGKSNQLGKGAGGGGGGRASVGSQASRPQRGDWPCHICGTLANRDWRERCRSCDAYRSVDMERAFAAHAQQQAQQQRRSMQQQQQQQQRQQQQRQQASRADDDRRQLRQQVESLQAELATAKAQVARTADAGDDDGAEDMGDGGGFSTWTEEERAKRVDLARGGLAYAVACHGEESVEAQTLREEIAALQRASREAKPFKAHRNQLERRRDELQRKQDRDETAVAAAKTEITELQTKVSALQASIDDRAKQLKLVTEELNELVRKSLEEDGGGNDDDGDRTSAAQLDNPWSALAAAVKALAAQPGVPAELSALFTQVQQVASGYTAAAATPQARTNSTGQSPADGAPVAASSPSPEAKPKAAAAGAHVVLAPHGRFGKAMAKSSPPPPRPQPATPPAAGSPGDGGASAEGGGAAAAAAAVAGGTGGAASRGPNDGRDGDKSESDAEMVEAGDDGQGLAAADIERSLSMLPDRDRRRLRAALRGGGARGTEGGEGGAETGEEGAGRRERERSPRPTKLNDQEL